MERWSLWSSTTVSACPATIAPASAWRPCGSGPLSWVAPAASNAVRLAGPASEPISPSPGPEVAAMRALVADDHPMYRYGLRTLLEATPGLEVGGERADEGAGWAAAPR